MLQLRLFGAFEVRLDGTPVALTSSRAQSLLACLALRPRPPQRQHRSPSCSGPTRPSRRRGRTCATCCTSCAARARRRPYVTPRTPCWRADAPSGSTGRVRGRARAPGRLARPRPRSTAATCWPALRRVAAGGARAATGAYLDALARLVPSRGGQRTTRSPTRERLRAPGPAARGRVPPLDARCTTPGATARRRCASITPARRRWSASWACEPSPATRAAYEALLPARPSRPAAERGTASSGARPSGRG